MTKRPLRSGFDVAVMAATAVLIATTSLAVYAGSAAAVQESAWDGVFTEEQATRGQETYQRECASCHLDDLLGDGIAPPLVGVPFSFRWSDLSVGDMLTAIRTTMPQGAPASLSVSGYVDIVAYLLKANEFPAGDAELPTDEDALTEIIITETQ